VWFSLITINFLHALNLHTYQELHVMVIGRLAVFFKVALNTVAISYVCESLWHSRHKTFRHEVWQTLIGGGVGGAQNCDANESEGGCKGFDGDANIGKENPGNMAWRGSFGESGKDEAIEGKSDCEGRGNGGVDWAGDVDRAGDAGVETDAGCNGGKDGSDCGNEEP
jgi:hypothetical protein